MFILLLYCCSHNIIIRIPHTPLYVPLVHSLCSLFILDSIYQHTNTVHLLHRCYYEHTLINVCECHHLLCLMYWSHHHHYLHFSVHMSLSIIFVIVSSISLSTFFTKETVKSLQGVDCQNTSRKTLSSL